jgi:hypothetical protein
MKYMKYIIASLRAIVAGKTQPTTQVSSFGKSRITEMFPFETNNGVEKPMLNVTLSSPSGTVNSVIGLGVYDEEEYTTDTGEIKTKPARNLWRDNGQCLQNRTGLKFPEEGDLDGLAIWCEAVSALYMNDGDTTVLIKAGANESTITSLKRYNKGIFCNTYRRIDPVNKTVSIGIEFPERDAIKAKQSQIRSKVSLLDDDAWSDDEPIAKPVAKAKPKRRAKAKVKTTEEDVPF